MLLGRSVALKLALRAQHRYSSLAATASVAVSASGCVATPTTTTAAACVAAAAAAAACVAAAAAAAAVPRRARASAGCSVQSVRRMSSLSAPVRSAAAAAAPAAATTATAADAATSELSSRRFRNVAIVAHVDHGKTTLVDKLIKQAGNNVSADRVMDHNALEKERGITIMSKVTRVEWKGHTFNIVDTPGHQDFGGEVERVLSMVDTVVLVVDATEGPMSQTKFVLMKALKNNLNAIVVVNKVDRDSARLQDDEVQNEIMELFMMLDASNTQLEYPLLYASSREGWAIKNLSDSREPGMTPLLDTILEAVASPKVNPVTDPFTMLVSNIEYDNFVGRVMRGKLYSGTVRVGDRVQVLHPEASTSSAEAAAQAAAATVAEEGRITKIFCMRDGLVRHDLAEAIAGDIVSVAGLRGNVNDTICHVGVTAAIPALPLDPPTIAMTFSVNDSPLGGQEGKLLTSTHIRERLVREAENNVAIALRIMGESVEVHGRGELQLGILIETMRREGFELSISPPRVLFRQEEGKRYEPVEDLTIDVDSEFSGIVIDKVQLRGGEMVSFKDIGSKVRLNFIAPSRGLLGYSSEIKTDTRGTAVMNSIFHSYRPFNTKVQVGPRNGKLVSMAGGKCTAYALNDLQERGTMFISPGDVTYEGQVVGESSRALDLEVNPTRAKKSTNVRSKVKDENVILTPPRAFSLEEMISYVSEGEVIEVTPTLVRLRKSARGAIKL
ncbi:GTP-binding protein TypA [Capsaspora owczarzaki ATCC 30864]|uniref:GTP-binding protein TypA n=1 Tax=Capsaspora owczarzaki (strain ATCC 30864) TaxID=595528 RepID=A0A0D2WJV9_CAPO3|nr:GTP-binding protein TypA [Capsaspora owczarzaki ATCC 30864]KJE90425.1 GTP-binding protein TypA [Capsaspora owczarzaki ATCC 30864]|eukprot:XP_004364607.1 GTP-binding protein TypA [Capsaspora owczarzaki ATCC 30864]